MSKMTAAVKEKRFVETTKAVTNFMGGTSYEVNPLDTLKLVTASSIFGEPQYYRDGEFSEKTIMDGKYSVEREMADYVVLSMDKYGGMKTSDLMEKVIDDALEYDYAGVLAWAVDLREKYFMRLNPQVIMVRAAMSDKRQEFTEKNKTGFSDANMRVMSRADDVIAQFTYYLFKVGNKKKLPNILKRSWAKKIETLSRYEIYKYRNHGLGLVDTVRVCHANNDDINELMQTGTLVMPEEKKTWETLRASGKSWVEILEILGRLPHMALLRNLRGIFTEIDDYEKTVELMDQVVAGVEKGKQFPYRYMSASKALTDSVNNIALVKDKLEECMDVSCNNLPHLAGHNAFLSDNSGSAWGTCPSEYGSVKIAEIDNLSAVIGAVNSDRGTVVAFGDTMKKFEISKRQGILHQADEISKWSRAHIGGSTENGVWLFLQEAIDKKIVYDNIFIYSDQQAGHGGLYGTHSGMREYEAMGCATRGHYIDVAKLINIYRSKVNPKVNVFCVQTAGYTNVLVPENGYRMSILYGWTGKELVYADMINKFWDDKDLQKEQEKNSQQKVS